MELTFSMFNALCASINYNERNVGIIIPDSITNKRKLMTEENIAPIEMIMSNPNTEISRKLYLYFFICVVRELFAYTNNHLSMKDSFESITYRKFGAN